MEQTVLLFGEPVTQLPQDLYIPPDALRVLLDTFSGPLDEPIYLIRKQNIDILDIPVTLITEQYLAYLNLMEEMDMVLAAEYLLMAATLAEIKARMMLPRPPQSDDDEPETDPRARLAEQILAYIRTGKAAENLAALPRVGAGTALSAHLPPAGAQPVIKPPADAHKLADVLRKLWLRHDLRRAHEVENESYSLAERMDSMQARLRNHPDWQPLTAFYGAGEGREGFVVSLMAMLELDRSQLLEWQQAALFAPVNLRLRQSP
ncbi:segregation and condensation protein A [Cardiobacterium valvarum]|uniref:Segregation and condensation protein A n=1 Tax=Cardiobacterium valvarum F0432 TaxID=797473 RepID=G9ZJQ8_9GAMM|nr:ScpA family protein [Cardiobacterium valvarum]EHM49588.1 ScpA/B protein [Cardiobacterium valvarum F0432]